MGKKQLCSSMLACAAVAGSLFVSNVTNAAVIYTTPGATYGQNFDALPTTPTNTSLQSTIPWKDDDINGVTATQTSIVGWYLYHAVDPGAAENGTSGHNRFRITTGNTTTGSFYSFGVAGTNAVTDRALGDIGSTTLASNPPGNQDMLTGLRLTNNAGYTLTEFTITYTGEQWRNNGNALTDSIFVGYSVGNPATTVNDGASFTAIPSMTFTSPVASATAVTLDGNAPANRVTGITATITGIQWAVGTDLWIRWNDLQIGGNDHALGIDDVSFVATPEPGSMMLLAGAGILGMLRRRAR